MPMVEKRRKSKKKPQGGDREKLVPVGLAQPEKAPLAKGAEPRYDEKQIPAIVIEHVAPEIDGGVFAVKALVGEAVTVEADIYKDGRDVLGASIKYRRVTDTAWKEAPMRPLGNDRWQGVFTPVENTRYLYTIEAWVDPLRSWLFFMNKKCPAYPNVQSDLEEGLRDLREIKKKASARDKPAIDKLQKLFRLSGGASDEVLRIIQSDAFQALTNRYPLKRNVSKYHRNLVLSVDRQEAGFSAWYEMFPRSQGKSAKKSGTFRDCVRRLPDIRRMGFDVLYLPPIHPIGTTNRKGRNNSLKAKPGDPGSPWAIGGKEGGHKAIHPELGTMKDFQNLVTAAREHGIEIALDIAFQCSPDHPYVRRHPDWFYRLPDGTIRFAENPPKKYEDIYPLDFYCKDWRALWDELKSVFLFWIGKGVKIFRVDNPHTKPLRFWEWLIEGVRRDHPEVIFLSEAFTRPKVMKFLAKAGFSQSYTYFTWRNSKGDLREYLEELTRSEMKHYFRGNLFANTPDILHEYLQKGGGPAFKTRLVLAATLSSVYGIYSGYELCENTPLREGSEEYLNSEKYEIRSRDWNQPGNLREFIGQVNRIRAVNPALREYKNLRFYDSHNDNILCYGKKTADNSNIIIIVVNLDPFHVQEDTVSLPIWEFGLQDWQTYQMKDLLTGEKYYWRGQHNYVRLDPAYQTAHVFRLKP